MPRTKSSRKIEKNKKPEIVPAEHGDEVVSDIKPKIVDIIPNDEPVADVEEKEVDPEVAITSELSEDEAEGAIGLDDEEIDPFGDKWEQ